APSGVPAPGPGALESPWHSSRFVRPGAFHRSGSAGAVRLERPRPRRTPPTPSGVADTVHTNARARCRRAFPLPASTRPRCLQSVRRYCSFLASYCGTHRVESRVNPVPDLPLAFVEVTYQVLDLQALHEMQADGLIESDLQKLARTGRSLFQNEFQDLRVHFPHNLLARHLIKTLSQTGRNPAYTRAEFRNELTEEILVGLQNAVDQPARCSLGRPSSPFHAATANVPDQIDQRLALKVRCGAGPLFPTQ